MDPKTAALLATTLFPTSDHSELMVSFYGFEAQDAPMLANASAVPSPVDSLGLTWRRLSDTEDADEDDTGTGELMRLRMTRDANGDVSLENLEVEFLLASLRSRPALGDKLDFSLLVGSWDEVWRWGDTGRMQWQFYSPMRLNLLGFANNDMDDDDKLKYYIGAGAGVGGEVLVRVAGPLAVQARLDAELSAKNRYRREGRNTTRQELDTNAELALGWLLPRHAILLGAWGQQVTQWEPRDEDGRDGIDRQYLATGVNLSMRFYKDREIFEEPDLDQLLDAIRQQEGANDPSDGLFTRPTGSRDDPEPQPLDPDNAVPSPDVRDPSLPLEVHWSEVEPTAGNEPVLPAGLAPGATCTLRFFVDPTGQPYDIRPEQCPSELLAPTMEAAWTWRFKPIVENGDTVSAQFAYTFTPALAP